MDESLIKYKQQKCIDLLAEIAQIKAVINSGEELESRMISLNRAYLCLVASLDIQPSKAVEIENEWKKKVIEEQKAGDSCIEKEGEMQVIEIGKFKLFVYEGSVLDIETKYEELAPFFIGKSAAEGTELAGMYADYGNRCCDECGKYYLEQIVPGSKRQTPVLRVKKEDFSLAYHQSCV
ncbi:hypothetical protein ENBRE01_1844 [Enteropsectra breve]|nr:hypothetical protein ENBRE01_1844 [Enteropsectra breve]